MDTEWWSLILFRVSYTCSSDYSVYDGECTYTHLLHAHLSAHSACTVTFAHLHACAHTRMAQVMSKRLLHVCVIPLHPPLSCLTRLCCSLTVISRSIPTLTSTTFLPNFPVLEAQDMRNSARACPVSTQVMSPRSSTRSLLTIQTSKNLWILKSHTGKYWIDQCTHDVWTDLCFASFLWWFWFVKWTHATGNREKTEREEREGSVISVVESMSKKSRRNSVRSHSLQTHREFYPDERNLQEHFERRAQRAILGENSVQSKLHSTEYNRKIQNLERKFRIRGWMSKKTIIGSQSMGRSSSARENPIVWQIGDEGPSSSRKLCKKLPRNWRIEKTLLSIQKTTKIGRISCAAWSGITNSVSLRGSSTKITRTIGIYWRLENLPRSWLTEQLWQYPRSSPSSYYLEFKKTWPRRWNAAKNTREYVYSWKRFWSSTCSTKSWRITQWFKKFGGVIGDSEDRRTWEKWERRTVAINTFTLLFSKSKEKKSTRQKKSYVYDLPCRGKCDLYSEWHDNFGVISSRRCICKIPWPNGISKLGREFSSWSLRKSEESRARIAEAGSSLKDLINPKTIYGKKISLIMKSWIWWWRQNWNDATMSIHTSKRGSESKSRKLERTTDFSEGVWLLIWSTNLQGVEPWQKGKEQKFFTPNGRLENFFSGRQMDIVQEQTLVVFYTRMPRGTVRQRGKKMEDARKCRQEQASSPVPKVKKQTDVNGLYSLKACPVTGAKKIFVYGWQDEKDRRVTIDIIPCVVVTSLETDAFVAIVAYFEVEKRRYSRSSCCSEKKVQGCVSQNSDPLNSVLRKAEELGLNASAGHTWNSRDALGTKLKSEKGKGQSGGIIQEGERHECLEEQTPEEASRQADCTSKVAWKLARKKIKLRFSLLWRRQRHSRSYVCCGFGSFNAQCWARET